MALVRYRPNRKGIRALLGSNEVRADLEHRAEDVAAVAQAAYDAQPPHTGKVEVTVESNPGQSSTRPRARAAVVARHPAALHIEADRRVLGSAVDAAAGYG